MTSLRNKIANFAMPLIAVAASASVFGSAAVAEEPNPYAMANDTWITISGSVESVRANSFMLDYGDGLVTVEMDDGDRDADAYKLIAGDNVTVTGKIDDDFYELTTIEASSVYVENLGTTFFASAIDEVASERLAVLITVPVVVSEAIVSGTVTEIDSDEFTLDTGLRKLNVEVGSMPYDPLDDEGYQKLRVGDRVRVQGKIDRDLFDGREIEANYIIKLAKS